jgi:hypothetical protein
MPGPERHWRGKHPQRRLTGCSDRPTNLVLRRPLESAQYTSLAFGKRCREAGVRPSMGSVAAPLGPRLPVAHGLRGSKGEHLSRTVTTASLTTPRKRGSFNVRLIGGIMSERSIGATHPSTHALPGLSGTRTGPPGPWGLGWARPGPTRPVRLSQTRRDHQPGFSFSSIVAARAKIYGVPSESRRCSAAKLTARRHIGGTQ